MLDKQIQILNVDTSDFYSNHEKYLHNMNFKLKIERNKLIENANNIEIKLCQNGVIKSDLKLILKQEYSFLKSNTLLNLAQQYYNIKNIISMKNKKIKKYKNKLLCLLENKINANIKSNGKHHIRKLNENQISNKNIISVFESSFTRMIGAVTDNLSEDFMVVQTYYFNIIKDLIYYGFTYKGEKYIYFTSSAGQIRTKKIVFIKESVWKKYEKTIMCGLTISSINKKGGNNPNKHLAYMALANSATDNWDEFDIDKTIVIDDFETNVYGTFDFINEKDYSITRKTGYIPITHTDGSGMILPYAFGQKQKNIMIRLSWIKGLLGVFDFRKFIQYNNCSPVVKDIYGIEHDIIKEDIQVIFTKSQFKMSKYYSSWEEYKKYFRKYNCTAGYTNPEEDRIKNSSINYQMLQTLTDITEDEMNKITEYSINKLNNICSSIDNAKSALGITPYNQNKTPLQKAIDIYPELLNDIYIKNKLKDIKNSMIKKYKSGKLQVHGKYTFVLPDFYAACEFWFLKNKNPKGLLRNNEVFCRLFPKNNKLDCLRSPHLYREHAIRKNQAYNDDQKIYSEWYDTNAVYTSCQDLISKMLQFDTDGDKLLVVADKNIISVAEKNMKNIVPLYYNMKKASPSIINNQSIYDGLCTAFTGSNIGQYSNNISKIWNNDIFICGTEKEKQEALDVIKILCMENNFKIDFAKTLYMPKRPEKIQNQIKKYTKENVPYFFKYSKDKEIYQVATPTKSFINKLDKIIPNSKIEFSYASSNKKKQTLLSFNYSFLMTNTDIEISKDLITEYNKLNKMYSLRITEATKKVSGKILTKSQMRKDFIYGNIIKDIKLKLAQLGYKDFEIADMLVKYLYEVKNSKHKDILWLCYGEYLLNNLKKHVKRSSKDVQCIECGEWFSVNTKNTKTNRCQSCYSDYRKNYYKENKRENRLNGKCPRSKI